VNLSEKIKQKFIKPNEPMEIFFYLDQINPVLEKNVNAQFFALGCTPVVNLFSQAAEPFALTHTQSEYHLVPDAQRSPQATEIYALQRVIATTDTGKVVEYQPFYSSQADEGARYYYANRKPAWQDEQRQAQGTEIFLSFTDQHFKPAIAENWVISAETLCSNRDLPAQLPFGGNEPHLRLLTLKIDALDKIKCLIPITAARRSASGQNARSRYVAHLSLNHLSLLDDKEGIATLLKLLKLYDFSQAEEHQNVLEGLLSLRSKAITLRNPQACRGNVFWQGVEITVQVDESKFSGTSLYLFGSVLERFFALYASINLFTQLVFITQYDDEIHRWPPRIGEKLLLPAISPAE
jgi:type VI secretion system protein ImpG